MEVTNLRGQPPWTGILRASGDVLGFRAWGDVLPHHTKTYKLLGKSLYCLFLFYILGFCKSVFKGRGPLRMQTTELAHPPHFTKKEIGVHKTRVHVLRVTHLINAWAKTGTWTPLFHPSAHVYDSLPGFEKEDWWPVHDRQTPTDERIWKKSEEVELGLRG